MLRLRSSRFDEAVRPAVFVVPFGPTIPIAAIAIAMSILAGATAVQLRNGGAALVVGAMLYVVARARAGPGR
jgi:hypothetical protein